MILISKEVSALDFISSFGWNKWIMKIDKNKLEKFIRTARNIVTRDATDSFSLKDVYYIARKLRLDGLIYLEKFDDGRHVTVLLDLNKDCVTLYDPLSGIKVKRYNKIQFGMYCKPVGSFRDEFQVYEQQQGLDESGDVLTRYGRKGRLLFEFLNKHVRFKSMYAESISNMNDLPVLQDNQSFPNCAPISLFIMSLCN